MGNEDSQNVIVTDINMPFRSMVNFIFKWTIASIPTAGFIYFFWKVTYWAFTTEL